MTESDCRREIISYYGVFSSARSRLGTRRNICPDGHFFIGSTGPLLNKPGKYE